MKFLELILFLVHVTAGQPGRGTEITAIRYANSMNAHRNIFIHDGQVMILTQYHKSIVITDQLKVIPRFLPPRISQMLTVYLTHVLPFRKHINQDISQRVSEEYLWSTDEKAWDTDDLSRILKREFKRIDFPCTTASWRHTSTSLNRKHVRSFVEEDE